MTKKPSIQSILDSMHKMFKDYPLTELNFETPFQCLIAVMMSAQTTDIQVNKVTDSLFESIKSPQDVLDMWKEQFGESIRTVWLWTSKRDNVYATAQILVDLEHGDQKIHDQYGYFIPNTMEWMIELPGVWMKTAKVVLYVLFRQKRIAVDTHVHRVMNRLWVVCTKTPEQSSKQLEIIIPDDYKAIAHHSIIYFGRYLCKARKPECYRCPLFEACTFEDKNLFNNIPW